MYILFFFCFARSFVHSFVQFASTVSPLIIIIFAVSVLCIFTHFFPSSFHFFFCLPRSMHNSCECLCIVHEWRVARRRYIYISTYQLMVGGILLVNACDQRLWTTFFFLFPSLVGAAAGSFTLLTIPFNQFMGST